VGVLKNLRTYLSGAIEHADPTEDWRTPVKTVLASRFGIKVFDPFDDPKQEKRARMAEYREQHRYDDLADIVHKFVRMDLSIVDRADLVIAYVPYKVPTTGTVHEIILANNAKKPTLLVCPQGKNRVADWYWGFIPHQFMFGSWDDLYAYLAEVDDGKHADNDRWYFSYNFKDQD
jgi:nucleoside 2-deoxyribosyltransferase